MRSAPLFGLLFLAATGLRADDFTLGPDPMPERAGIPVAYVSGQRYNIVAYAGNDPVVVINGTAKPVHGAPISVIPGGSFAGASARLASSAAIAMSASSLNTSARGTGDYMAYYAKLTPDQDLPQAFLILLVYLTNPEEKYTDVPKVFLLGTSLGDLRAGRTKDISTYFPPVVSKTPSKWMALVFSRGAQVWTGDGNKPLDWLFDITEHVGQRKAIERRSSGDFPVEVYRRFPLSFTDADKKRLAGQTVNVDVTISPAGAFDVVRVDGDPNDDLEKELAREFSTWLFLPLVKNGQPQSTTVVLPIKF
jgi:hypothetical protein